MFLFVETVSIFKFASLFHRKEYSRLDTLSSVKEQEVIDKLRLPILAFLLKPLVLGALVYHEGQEEGVSTEFPDIIGDNGFFFVLF